MEKTKIMKQRPYLRIMPDIDSLYDDCEGYSYDAYDDTIYNSKPELGPLFSIVVPGLYEWQMQYVNETDFADTVTNPDFDWATWHYEGLCFAKAIWEQLPRCYHLYYAPPYEDRSGTLEGEFEIDEHVDDVIERLRPMASKSANEFAVHNNVGYDIEREDDHLEVSFNVGRSALKVSVSFNRMTALRHWLNDIIDAAAPVCSVQIADYEFHFARQTVGQHTEMGRFWISERLAYDIKHDAYVNTVEFVRGLYLSFMTELGFHIYHGISDYPCGEERAAVWKPYNDLKSRKIEAFIYGLPPRDDDKVPLVDETFVMFPDYGGCIFWDTMGIGSGDYDCVYSDFGDFKLNVPGLEKWSEFYDNPDPNQTYKEWWLEGWQLAKEVRKQMPDNIDIYYMCFDPKQPGRLLGYGCRLPRLIVPSTNGGS